MGGDDYPFVRYRNKTIDGALRTMGLKVLDIYCDGIILSVNLVDSLNHAIFSVAGMKAIVLA